MRRRLLVAGLVAAVVAPPWVFAAQKLLSPRPVSSDLRPSALVWGDRVISGTRAMSGWLSAHGARYRNWAHLHPQAVAILTDRLYVPPRLAAAGESSSSAASAAKPSPIPRAKPRPLLKVAVQVLLLAVASVLLAAAFAPPFLLNRGPPHLRSLVQANRAYVAMVAIAILLGYAIQAL